MGLCSCTKPAADSKPKSLKKRSCTDLLCLILFVVFVGALVAIFAFGIATGDWHALVYDADYLGNRCGVGAYKDKTKAFYPRLALDMLEPHNRDAVAARSFTSLKLYTLCVATCPSRFDLDSPDLITDYGFDPQTATTQAFGDGTRASWISATPTVSIVNRCIPREQTSNSDVSLCALPKCTDPAVVAAGGVCSSGAYNGTGVWEVCPDVGSGTTDASTCTEQQSLCQVTMKDSTKRSFEVATGDAESAALLGGVAAAVGNVFEITTAIYDAWLYVIVGGIVCPIALAFVYMLLLYLFAKTIIWGLLIVLIVCQLAATFICFAKSGIQVRGISGADLIARAASAAGNVTVPSIAESALAESEESDQWMYTIAFIVMGIATIITLIMVILSRKKIARAAAIVKEATTVFKTMPMMMFFPTLSTCCQILVCVYFIVTILLVQTTSAASLDLVLGKLANTSSAAYQSLGVSGAAAAPNVDPIGALRDLSQNDNFTNFVSIFVLYGFFVLIQWVAGIAWCAMSGATYYWYFFRKDAAEKTNVPITRSLMRTLVYHTGSVAFAAFVIALCDMLRAVVAYVERQVKPLKDKQFLLRLLFMCVNCCVWCLKKSVKFVSYYGLVFVACTGTNFCSGCYKTFFFFLQNPGQVAINATVTFLLRSCALFSMPLACGIVFYYVIGMDEEIGRHAIYPSFVIVVLAALMTTSCMTVFECTITTIFVCCFQDKAEYGGSFMSDQLARAFDIRKDKKGSAEPASSVEPTQSL